ncbi:MAG: 50S ribosomal protein L25 [Planctomycetes bacterium]|nr:50S ribosomal protein L25 [Planctomycetota bacterium]
MAERATLKVDKRSVTGKWAVRRLRSQGIVPGVLYGHGEPAVPVQLPAKELIGLVRRGARVLDLTNDGPSETVLIRDLHWDVFGLDILHVDFARVAADERIKIEVRLELRGTAPGVEEGGVLSQLVHNVEVECLATEIPEVIRVDLRGLHLDQAIHVRDLVVPPGVKVLADPDVVVAQVTKKIEEVAPVVAEEVAGPVEPEIVGRRVAEEPAEEPEK